MKKNFTIISVIVALSAFAFVAKADSGIRTAYVDTDQVLTKLTEYREIDRDARFNLELKEEEGQKMLDKLKKLGEELSALSEDKRKPRMAEYKTKQEALLRFREKARDEIFEKQSLDMKRVASKIQDVIETIGKDKNMTLVFDLKPILYLDRTKVTDLTEKVIERLNADYEKEKEKLRRKLPKRVK